MKQLAHLMHETERVLGRLSREEQLLYAMAVWRKWGGDPVTVKNTDQNTEQNTAQNTAETLAENTVSSPQTPLMLVVPEVASKAPNGSKPNKRLELQEKALEILAFLNAKAGKNFRPVEENLRFIRQRLATASVEDCKGVIVRKTRAWAGTEHSLYLRPKTLFNATNFEQYMGEQGKPS